MSNDKQQQQTPPKTEIPQNPFTSFDPMAFWTASQQNAAKMLDQYAAMEAAFVARAQSAVASWAQLTQDAITYAAQLSAQARKLSVDAARKVAVGA